METNEIDLEKLKKQYSDSIFNTFHNRIKKVQGKRTSEGYKPKPNEEVELRGD